MMQGVAVKYHASILWDVHSFVSEVLSCVMGSSHPKWSVSALDLSMGKWSDVIVSPLDIFKCYLFDNGPNIWTVGLIFCVGQSFTSHNSIQLFISLGSNVWVRGY